MPRSAKDKRTRPQQRIGSRIYIICEGQNTEVDYFERYANLIHDTHTCQIIHPEATTPEALVRETVKIKQLRGFDDDVFWVVFDKEQSSDRSKASIRRAYELAGANGIRIAISCVCFEVWLLLHMKNSKPRPFLSASELLKSSDFRGFLTKYKLPTNTKSKMASMSLMKELVTQERVKQAKKLAKQMDRDWKQIDPEKKPYELDSYTNVHELIDDIDCMLKINSQ